MSATVDNRTPPDLVVEDLSVRYGHATAVHGISLRLERGSVVAVLGANGAGKTSTLRAIAGGLDATVRGEMRLFGKRVSGRSAHRVVARGMVLIPEGRQIVAPLTVEENLLLGSYRVRGPGRAKRKLAEVHELFPVLFDRRTATAGLLSGGEQQMLAFGRALMAEPRVILMDEPSMGLSPLMVDRVIESVAKINQLGTSILIVEQNANAAFRVANYAYVLEQGRIVGAGPAARIRNDPTVVRAFFGLAE